MAVIDPEELVWNNDKQLQDYRKSEQFTTPIDHHNIAGEFIPEDHGFDGLLSVTLPGYPRAMDLRMIQATTDLPDEFPFNEDYNSGYHMGIDRLEQSTVHNGTRSSSETVFLGPKYLSVKTFDTMEFTQDAGKQYIPFRLLKKSSPSAGSIGTPYILLYSGIGDADELSSIGITPTVHLPDIRKNLTDHLRYALAWTVNSTDTIENVYLRNETFQRRHSPNGRQTVQDISRVLQGISDETAHFELIFSASNYSLGFHCIPLLKASIEWYPSRAHPTHWQLLHDTSDSSLPSSAYVSTPSSFPLISQGTYQAGDITINSTNPLDPPLINPNLSAPQDLTICKPP
ncbi:uncharacterized protein EV420DRAFT_1710780 [Desarmillaria tabescens]|uniref:Glucose-methanol-choline oxidoreductase N-terminal domain-containing protein n=1 Tax=Armillaria tabescens TaxID=1929756 RepID=A0AA39TPW9_ARMTA|nr:uncharacterized protein EV420DRAFT_1710780 [Desarmillaria tabescens]KAK0466392.1 hypothetical protein EV420DRAFT_1710780 [Desarmillaria tabescens]